MRSRLREKEAGGVAKTKIEISSKFSTENQFLPFAKHNQLYYTSCLNELKLLLSKQANNYWNPVQKAAQIDLEVIKGFFKHNFYISSS